MAPADDDEPGGPFQGLPRPAHVRRRAKEADLPPATRSRDAAREEDWDDDQGPTSLLEHGQDAGPWEPAMRRDPRREADGRRLPPVPTGPVAPLVAGPTPAPAPPRPPGGASKPGTPPEPAPRPGLLTPAERIEARKAIGIGADGLAAALGLGPNGERRVRRWEKPDPDPDDRPPPPSIELLLKMAAEIPEAAAFLREQGRGALAERFRDRRPREG